MCIRDSLRDDIHKTRYICFHQLQTLCNTLLKYGLVLFVGFWCFNTLICFVYELYYKLVFLFVKTLFLYRFFHQSSASHMVPAVIQHNPSAAFLVSFSWNTAQEKIMVTRILSLSIGTTTLAGPSLRAL